MSSVLCSTLLLPCGRSSAGRQPCSLEPYPSAVSLRWWFATSRCQCDQAPRDHLLLPGASTTPMTTLLRVMASLARLSLLWENCWRRMSTKSACAATVHVANTQWTTHPRIVPAAVLRSRRTRSTLTPLPRRCVSRLRSWGSRRHLCA